jgi:hypothetical protein
VTRRSAVPGGWSALSVIVLSALEPDKLPDPFFMLAGGPAMHRRSTLAFSAASFTTSVASATSSLSICAARAGRRRSSVRSSVSLAPDGIYDENLLSIAAVRACRQRLEKRRT